MTAAQKHEIEVRWFDTCFPDYVTDFSGIVVGIQRNGQTRDELIEQVADEVYSLDEFPLGDTAYDQLKQAVVDAIAMGPEDRLWPVDTRTGTEIKDPESDAYQDAIEAEQPSAWFRVILTSRPMRIALDNQGSDYEQDGMVLVTCEDKAVAEDDRYIDGSTWECPRDMDSAYTSLVDRPTLVAELEAEGYEVDTSCYSAPTDEDMARFAAWDGTYR
jgi:hypothetical protein